jgi:hypothetical protein
MKDQTNCNINELKTKERTDMFKEWERYITILKIYVAS